MINTTKSDETKIFKPVQVFKAQLRTMILKEFQSELNLLTYKTMEEDQKMEEDLDFFVSENASQENILVGKIKKQDQIPKFLTNILYKRKRFIQFLTFMFQ